MKARGGWPRNAAATGLAAKANFIGSWITGLAFASVGPAPTDAFSGNALGRRFVGFTSRRV